MFGVITGGFVLWALLPAPAPAPTSGSTSQHPHLAAELRRITGAFGQLMPDDSYLTATLNAFVAQLGRSLRRRSRRVMGIGMPLPQILSASQFRATIAHECAQFYRGDTRLTPWLARNHNLTFRLLDSFINDNPFRSVLLHIPWLSPGYAALVLIVTTHWCLCSRVTSRFSIRQEFRCDELVCRFAGSEPHRRRQRRYASCPVGTLRQ